MSDRPEVTGIEDRGRPRALSGSAVYLPLPQCDEVVENGRRILLSRLGAFGAVVMSVVTLVALGAYPLTFCIGCEFPNPWGHHPVYNFA